MKLVFRPTIKPALAFSNPVSGDALSRILNHAYQTEDIPRLSKRNTALLI